MKTPTVGVAIASIPPRTKMLSQAVLSVEKQTHKVDKVIAITDYDHEGVSTVRNRAWRALDTDFVFFLDDDDVMYEYHVEKVMKRLLAPDSPDLVYPWFDVHDPWNRPAFDFLLINGESAEHHPFNDAARAELETKSNFIPVTVGVKRSMLELSGGFPQPETDEWPHEANEDWGCWIRMLRMGAEFAHIPERTWQWRWHSHHTMGRPDRW